MKAMIAGVLAALALVALFPLEAQGARRFSYGVSASEVGSTSARLWARPDRGGRVFLRVTRCRPTRGIQRRFRALRRNDLTVQTVIRRLRPGTRYCYRFRMRRLGRRIAGSRKRRLGRLVAISDLGTFVTAPAPHTPKTIRFAWSGDADYQPHPDTGRPFYNDFEIYRLMAEERNDFNVNLGDTIYVDTEFPGGWPRIPDAIDLQSKWRKYKINLSSANLQLLRRSGVTYNGWDDHEFINDFTRSERAFTNGNETRMNDHINMVDPGPVYRDGVRAFRDYMPVTFRRATGIYRSFRWGRNVEVFMLDERSFKSAKASANHVCDYPGTDTPDEAPTAYGSLARTEFSLLRENLRNPPPPGCLETINDPNRTMLGRRQYEVFTNAIKSSTATWKVIMNEVAMQQFYVLPYEYWEGYEAERQRLLKFLTENVKNVVVLTTDIHANLVNDIRFCTVENRPECPRNSGILEVTTGPVATMSYKKEINDEVGGRSGPFFSAGVWPSVFKAPPPQGVGMRCAAMDVYSYGQVTASDKTLRIDLKDINGQPVRDDPPTDNGPTPGPGEPRQGPQGPPCGLDDEDDQPGYLLTAK
jgi:phosphodiesterase/alkaline phosphatase D-like protein